MKTMTHARALAAILAATAVAAVGLAAPLQPSAATKPSTAPGTQPPTGPKISIQPNSSKTHEATPFPEPPDSQSAIDRRAQAERVALREQLDWNNLDPELQEALWDVAVGPDQLNDGHGVAQVRPSLRPDAGYDDRGGFDDRGINLVLLSWDYTTAASAGSANTFAFDMDLNVEGDVSFVGSLVSPDGTLRMKATEMRGVADATEGYTKNWDQIYNLGSGANQRLEGKACVSDLLGNLFTGGSRGNGQYHLAQLSGATGARLNDRDFTVASGATGATVFSTALDPEGILYVAGAYTQGTNLRCFVARHNPDATLSRTWINTDTLIASTPLRVVTDRRGGVYFMYTTSSEIVKVTKLSPYDGIADWTWSGAPGTSGAALELDSAGNPHVAVYTGTATNDWNTVKLDTATGAALWTRTVTNGRPVDLKIDSKGNVFVLGSKGSATARVEQYTALGTTVAGFVPPSFGTTGEPYKLALDWIGNPYVAITYGTTRMSTDVRKFNPATGAEVWQYQRSPVFNSSEVNGDVEIIDLVIDASGSLFVSGNRSALAASGGAFLSHEFFFIKYEQAYVSIPQIARSYPVTRIEGNSIWSPPDSDLGGVIPGWANTDRSIFTLNLTSIFNQLNSIPGAGLDDLTQKEVNYGLGTAGGGLDINVTNGQFDVFFRSSVSGGSYDATVSGELAIAIPGEDEINVGQRVNITINFDPDASGMELITNGRPELNAGIYARITADVNATLFGRDSVLEAFGAPNPFFDRSVGQQSFDYTEQLMGLNLFPIPPGGNWYELNRAQYPYDQLASGRIRFPNLGTEGSYTDASNGMTLSSRLSETFLDTHLSITNLVSILATNNPLSFTFGTPVGNDNYEASVELGILQAYLEGNVDLEQDLDLVMRPYVDLFYDSTGTTTRVYLNRVVDTNGNYSYQASTNSPVLPAAGFTITPTFGVRASLTNRTGFKFGALAGFAPLQIGAVLEIVGVDIIDLDLEPGKLEQDLLSPTLVPGVSNALNSGRLTLLDTTSSEFDFANDVVCAPIVVASNAANNFPQLIGCSREAARMIIYEQRTPTQAELNALAVGTEPMVLYGRKFFTGVGGNTVRIKHCGRTEVLDSTRLNEQALLVQVPKRFFLLPGVARLWVNNNNGKSETIEFTIEHPMPNFQGLAEPIWAGDPRWIDEGVVAIDGGTPLGNDSFIARRDYYTLLRTTLWNSTLAGSAISATSYFPDFKPWDTNPNVPCPPGFPALVVDGVALERKRPFVNDGFFRSKMQQGVYASPGFLTMELVNPGPGGGPSRTVTMEVPAPRPVISALTPAEVDPGSAAAGSELRIVVNGPESVPFFPGYERAKYGNFSPGSIVRLDGDPLRTEFVSSGHLVAYIPAASLNNFGTRMITVSTPANGTSYAELLVSGGGGFPDPQQVASGGVSVPMTLNVRWGTPVIKGVSNRTMTQNQPPLFPVTVNGLAPPDSHNFTIRGKNFAPNARVYWNGSPIPATRTSAGLIRATVSATEVLRLGESRIQVANPASSGSARLSNDYRITIEAP
jgi:hypothetical protein